MKNVIKGLLLILSICLLSNANAQTQPESKPNPPDQGAPYTLDKHIPEFFIESVTGKPITKKDLPSNYKYTCIIIFSPDCSHCEHEASQLNENADKLKNVFFVWDSYREMDLIKKFATKYNLEGKPNVIIGRDPGFTIPSFFRPRMTPFVALYKNGEFVKVWEQGVEPDELIKITQGK
jgi:thiol-disulfide isomerase/thioredoxin